MRQGEPGRGGNKKMTYRAGIACALLGATLCVGAPARSEEQAAAAKPGSTVVVDVRSDRIVLLDIARVGDRLVAVGERGFALVSDDGKAWKGVQTPITRQLTGVAFKDDKVGVAVGHGGSFVRTDDGGSTTRLRSTSSASESSCWAAARSARRLDARAS